MLTRFGIVISYVALSLNAPVFAQAEAEAFTEPFQEIELAVGDAGILAEMNVREGDTVTAKQVLARLDTRVLEASLRIAQTRSKSEGALNAAIAEYDLRKKQFEQLNSLHDRGHATQRELERAEADFRVSQARVRMAREDLHLQKLECERIQAQIDRRQIRSPINGIVSEVAKEVGESFSANEPQVMKIVQLDQLRAKFSLTPLESAGFKAGDRVQLRLTNPSRQTEGSIETVFPVMDAKSGTLVISVLIDNPKHELRSGDRCFMKTKSDRSKTRFTTK